MTYGISNGHMTHDITWLRKVKLVTPIDLQRNISKTAGDAIYSNNRLLDSLPWVIPVGYASDSLASC